MSVVTMPTEDRSTNALESQWMKHPDLYLTDGTLVLLAGNTLFRVYGGLLSKYSEVFSGMASPSLHQPLDEERYEECPLVRLSDSPEDLAPFLKALMYIDYFPGNGQAKPFRVVAGILRLSTKYMVSTLRERAISHIRPITPVNFEEKGVNRHYSQSTQAVFGLRNGGAPLIEELAMLLRECTVLHCLPWAYYMVYQRLDGFDSLLRTLTSEGRVPSPLLERTRCALQIGWRALAILDSNITNCIFSTGAEGCQNKACNEGFRAILFRDTLRARGHAKVFDRRERALFGDCDTCAAHFKRVEEIEMRKAWGQLPSCFELPSWKILLPEEPRVLFPWLTNLKTV